jgi:hypothetical protein
MCPDFTKATPESQNAALEHVVEVQLQFVESSSGFKMSPAVFSMMERLPPLDQLEILRLPREQREVDRMQHLVEERLQAYFQRHPDASYDADSKAQAQPSVNFCEGVRVVNGKQTFRVTSRHGLASAGGQTIVTAAPAQGAAGGAASGAAIVGGMKVLMSGDAAASPATESDDDQDEAPIPAMASTSPQAVASCARMRVVPIDHSSSSEKPAKELGKGKQKAADGMGGSAQKRKPNARSAAKPTETEPRAGTTAAKKQKKGKWHDTVKRAIKARKADECPSDSRWMSDVEAWFAEKQRQFEWLNIHELEAATVQLMIQMESDEIRDWMDDCLKKRTVELNMHVFNQLLRGGFN